MLQESEVTITVGRDAIDKTLIWVFILRFVFQLGRSVFLVHDFTLLVLFRFTILRPVL